MNQYSSWGKGSWAPSCAKQKLQPPLWRTRAREPIHGTLGVCCATSGGGMMNLAVGLAESFASGNSVLGIVGQIPRAQEGRGGFQDSSGKMGSSRSTVPGWYKALNQTLLLIERPGVIFFDAGNCAAHAASSLHIPSGWRTHIALGMGGMGYAVAGAAGAVLGREDCGPALVICGDGSFLMHGMEVHTAVEHGLPIIWIIFNDGKHGMCVTRQEIYFPGPQHTNAYHSSNFGRVGEGLGVGVHSRQVQTYSELLGLLEDMVREGIHGPHIIDCVIKDLERPPFKPFRKPGNI
jgi:thiamine pyrophosphate-dependent acetolactate synthase large subunit-like protein